MLIKARLEQIFRNAFTHLPAWKRLLMRAGIGLGGLGLVGQAVTLLSESGQSGPGTWSWSALGSGLGCLLGFVVGATLRIFLKLGMLVVGVLALALFGLSTLGWIDLPWDSLGETTGALGRVLKEQTEGLQTALTGVLPSSAMTGLGLFAGVTQKPLEDGDRRDASE